MLDVYLPKLNTFLVLIITHCYMSYSEASSQCMTAAYYDYATCSHAAYQHNTATTVIEEVCDNHTLYSNCFNNNNNNKNNINNNNNNNNNICSKQFRLSVFKQQVYATAMQASVLDMLRRCCGGCARCKVINQLEYLSDFNITMLNSSDIIFPVISDRNIRMLHGFHFLPLFKVPGSYYFTLQMSNHRIVEDVIFSCARMWPLLITCLMLTTVSGFIFWMIEHGINSGLPERFGIGMFEGFWWSFITMTTVGYGDKTPKSVIGRLYAIVWILFGLTIWSVFTATITSEIMHVHEHGSTDVRGRTIGVLKDRIHNIACVAQHGGLITETTVAHDVRGVDELLQMLENKTVDGILINKITYNHFLTQLEAFKDEYESYGKRWLGMEKRVLKSEKCDQMGAGTLTGSLSGGLMVKHRDDFEYFQAHFKNNDLFLRSCNSLQMNIVGSGESHQGTHNLFAPGGFFKYVVYTSLGIFGIMLFAGLLFEGKEYYKRVNTEHINVHIYVDEPE